MDIRETLKSLQDIEYKHFNQSLIPTISVDTVLGIRVPVLRKLSKDLIRLYPSEVEAFLADLPHQYFEENMLHSLLLNEIKDDKQCRIYLNQFLPYIDNWAVCDSLKPRFFKKHQDTQYIASLINHTHTYTIRFGILMLMKHYLGEAFKTTYLDWVYDVHHENYYVQMMQAWFYCEALIKQWDATIPYIERKSLPVFVHNKTISKCVDSYRLTTKQKSYLKTLKIK